MVASSYTKGYVQPGTLGLSVHGILGEWLVWHGNALISSVYISWRSVAHGGLREQGYREWDNGQSSSLLWHYRLIRKAAKPICRSNILYLEVQSYWCILGKTTFSECICGVVRLEKSFETSIHIRHLLGHAHQRKYVPESQCEQGVELRASRAFHECLAHLPSLPYEWDEERGF